MRSMLKQNTVSSTTDLASLISQAHNACDAQDFVTMTALCNEIVQSDSCNKQAHLLLACYGFWDPKLLTLDAQAAIHAAQRGSELFQDTEWFSVGTDIYLARKKQIAQQLEATLMMPSYTGAKQLHEVMQTWLALLMGLPYLHAALIESEITLCTNLCTRSKMGFMPNDRLVYTAYTTLNQKESYGDMFKRVLQPRLEQQKEYERFLQTTLQEHVAFVYDALAQNTSTPSQKDATLPDKESPDNSYRHLLENDLTKIINLTNKALYQQQIDELTDQRKKLKSYKIKQHRDITMRIATLEQKIAEIDNELAPLLDPLYQLLRRL